MELRLAAPGDAQSLLDIYGQYIRTPITFEYELPSPEEFAGRISSTLEQGYPYLVCEEAGVPLGYAYAHRIWARAAYQWGAELSIYLHPSAAGRGVGRRLYGALMELLRLQGVRTVYGVVTRGNPASEGLHQSLGFRTAALFQGAGYKNGAWHDVQWFEKLLAPADPHPSPLLPLSALAPEAVRQGLDSYSA